ncbi:PAS domain S-box protein [Mucilaginibacter sp. UYCu711]|uniref:PAS domain S-box protein n=1 Tax=Mucilaginibacter sp. UYCu711 TaxID=3156339 RepID=UPI003D1EA2AA
MFKSLKIPLAFLATGIVWAILMPPIITIFARTYHLINQDLFRSLNDFTFVIIITYVLYHEINRQQRQLARSEAEYRQLFESNPNPMWIYREKDLKFIKVNDAVVETYGYSKMRFLNMKVTDVFHNEDRIDFPNLKINSTQMHSSGLVKHKKSNGEIFTVSIVVHPVLFNKEECKMVLINDMTEITKKEIKLQESYQKIKSANQALAQINWSNSHEIRKPICSMLGLLNFLELGKAEKEHAETFKMLKECVLELDQITRENNSKVSAMNPWEGMDNK